MKTWTIGAVVWLALGSWLAAADEVKLAAAWQGKWQVTAMHSGDVELPEEFVKRISMQVEKADMTWQVNDQAIKARVTFVGTEDKPRPIDIVGVVARTTADCTKGSTNWAKTRSSSVSIRRPTSSNGRSSLPPRPVRRSWSSSSRKKRNRPEHGR